MNVSRLWNFQRIVRGVHFRVGRYLAEKHASATVNSNDGLEQKIRSTYQKINIGCGYDKLPGYLNVDMDPACSPDLLLLGNDDSAIPRQHFREVLAKDVLEHIPRLKSLDALLGWADYLADGGRLIVQTSSILGVASRLERTSRYHEHHSWTTCLFGNQAHPGDFHFTGFTEITLKVHLLAAGFKVERMELRDDWLLYAEASKVENWTTVCEAQIASDAEFMKAAYRHGVRRDPRDRELELGIQALSGGSSRKDVLRFIYASAERLHIIAEANGL